MKSRLFLFGINITIESNDSDFLETVNGNLYFFKKESVKNPPLIKNENLHISYLKNNRDDFKKIVKGHRKIANNVYISGNNYIFSDGNLMVQITKEDTSIKVLAQPAFRKTIMGLVKIAILSLEKDYFLLVRKLIMFPAFYLLEKKLNIFLLHGSAFAYEDRGVIMAGATGVGKTTAAIFLTLEAARDIKFLTDNFLLFDKDYIYPFPEYIRLHDDTLSIIRNISKLGQPIIRRHGRNHYELKEEFISGRIRPKVLFIPSLSEEDHFKKISPDMATDRLLSANDQVKEFHNYHQIGLLDYLDYEEGSIYKKRIEALDRLLSGIDIYEVSIKKGQSPQQWWEKIIDYVS